MATSQQDIADLPRTIDGRVPRHVRLYLMHIAFERGADYSEEQLARSFGISMDSIQRDIKDLQCPDPRWNWPGLPLESYKINETRWRIPPSIRKGG